MRISGLSVSGILAADAGGTSDPYASFYTRPANLLGPWVPATTVKWLVNGGAQPEHEPSKARKRMRWRSKRRSSTPITNAVGNGAEANDSWGLAQASSCDWSDSEVPLLRPLVADLATLECVTLIISLNDCDKFSTDDPLGNVFVPLGKLTGRATSTGPWEYQIQVEQPLNLYNTTVATGWLRCKITVSSNASLAKALAKAKHDGAGIHAAALKPSSRWPVILRDVGSTVAKGLQIVTRLRNPLKGHTWSAPSTGEPGTPARTPSRRPRAAFTSASADASHRSGHAIFWRAQPERHVTGTQVQPPA